MYEVEITSIGLQDAPGFRDDGIVRPVFSVFLGDSFVWGYGVDIADSVSERFEQLIGKDSVNMGMTSWTSPIQYARAFEKYGITLKPQYVFIGFFVGNDFGDVVSFSEWEESHTNRSYPEWYTNRVRGYSTEGQLYRIRRSLYDHSSLYRLLSERINFSDIASNISDNIVHVNLRTSDLYLNKQELPTHVPGLTKQVESVTKALKEIKERGKQNNIIPIVFIIPTKEMVYQDYFSSPELKTIEDPRYSAVLTILGKLEMNYVDLLPVFKEKASDGDQLYFSYDGHWNAQGHLLAAELIRDFVDSKGLR